MTNFKIKKVFGELPLSKKSQQQSLKVFKTVGNIKKEAIEAYAIDVRIMWVSNYKKF